MVNKDLSPASCCPVCDFVGIHPFLTILQVPVHCNLLWMVREQALRAPAGEIRLGFCLDCGHIFNLAFDSKLMEYSHDYENSLHFSPRFQEYARSLALRLLERYQLYDKDIIEIGSGRGDFLRLLCQLGGNRGVGFDPSYGREPSESTDADQITFIRDFYSERYAGYQADLICCRHVLEHIEHPVDFIANVHRSIGDRLDTAVYFEVPNVLFTLQELGIWDVIYEHCSYFSRSSLARAFWRGGFNVDGIRASFAGQFLGIEARPSRDSAAPVGPETGGADEMADDVLAFAERYRRKVQTWQQILQGTREAGQRVVVWGAGSKGVTFLNALKTRDQIEFVVDINPRKQGMYIAGTGQQIVAPEFLRDYAPDVVIVMNPVYMDEIGQLVYSLGLQVQLKSA